MSSIIVGSTSLLLEQSTRLNPHSYPIVNKITVEDLHSIRATVD